MNARKATLAAALFAMSLPLASAAAVDVFLKLGDIKGESTDKDHKGEIVVESWSFGARASSSVAPGGGAGAGKSCLSEIALVKLVDSASPPLLQATMLGARIPTATMAVRRAGEGERDYLIITMKDVIVTSVSQTGSGETPMESLTLSFGTLKMVYKPQDPKGGLGGDVETTVSGRC